MRQIKINIREGEMIPKGYGVAWLNIDSYSATCYPIPLNIIVGAVRKAWFWLKNPRILYESGYEKGYMKGEQEGRDYAFKQYKRLAIKPEVKTLIERGIDAMTELFRIKDEEKRERVKRELKACIHELEELKKFTNGAFKRMPTGYHDVEEFYKE